ncbi:unnamed protein product, partial [Heterotrigona itama]
AGQNGRERVEESVGSRRMVGAEDARMGCENVGTSATSLPLEIINPVK